MSNTQTITYKSLVTEANNPGFSFTEANKEITALAWNKKRTTLELAEGFDISSFKKMQYLDLAGMGLRALPVMPKGIKALCLGGDNYFREGWENLAACASSLTSLSLSGSNFENYPSGIPVNLPAFEKLVTLACKNAVLRDGKVPSVIGQWKSLENVDFSGTSISPGGADAVLAKLNKLRDLAMVGCELNRFPMLDSTSKQLQRISLQNNNISDLPYEAFEYTKVIDLTDNPISPEDTVFADGSGDQITWKELAASENASENMVFNISVIPEMKRKPTKKQGYTNLSNNNIAHLPSELWAGTASPNPEEVIIISNKL